MQIFTAANLATRYGITPAAVYQRIKAGTLPAPSDQIGGAVVWTLADIEAHEQSKATKTVLEMSGLTATQLGELLNEIRPWGKPNITEYVIREVFAMAHRVIEDKKVTLKLAGE